MSRKKSNRNKAVAPLLLKTPSRRKGPQILTLVIMGGAALFLLKGCDDDEAAETVYATPYECSADSHSFDVCNAAFDEAKTEFYNNIPQNLSQIDCEQKYGTGSCQYGADSHGFIPAFAGFILGQALTNNQRKDCRYDSNYCSNYSSRPVWSGSSGNYSYSSIPGKNYNNDSHLTRVAKVTTVSRGGYGKSSSARGSWGG